jgi:hypothetical protein
VGPRFTGYRGPTAQLARFDFADGPSYFRSIGSVSCSLNLFELMGPPLEMHDGGTATIYAKISDNVQIPQIFEFFNMDVVFVVQFISKFPAMHSR